MPTLTPENKNVSASRTNKVVIRGVLVRGLLKSWAWFWCIIAAPFGYITVLCSLIGLGPKKAKNWAKHCGLPWFP